MKILHYFYKKASWPIVVITLFAYLMFMVLVLPRVSEYTASVTNNGPSPDTSFIYTSSELYEIFSEYGAEGRTSYVILRLTFDMIWPIAYTAFVLSITALLLKKLNWERYVVLLLIPLAPLFLDYIENILLSTYVLAYPKELVVFGTIASGISLLKWLMIGVSYFFVLYLGIISFIKYISRQEITWKPWKTILQ